MIGKYHTPDAVANAYQIVEMHERILALEAEITDLRKYKEDYFELLKSSMSHGDTMMRHLLDATLANCKEPEHGKDQSQ